MDLEIKTVMDRAFEPYGRILYGYNFSDLIENLKTKTEAKKDAVEYVPGTEILENTAAYKELSDNVYGGMPVQIGYCNGTNTKLNCLEYHRDSEINIGATDFILLLAKQQDCMTREIDTLEVEAFFVPAGTAVEVYATTLHYAPCSARLGEQFKVAVVLPKGTNLKKPDIEIRSEEDKRLFAANKWLIAHPEADEVKSGAVIGICGDNIDISSLI
ncbi:MAG: DUF4867 family protein [Clostridiales bacterium]|nr:DUF4867 family protein [Clostridiales bacterium]